MPGQALGKHRLADAVDFVLLKSRIDGRRAVRSARRAQPACHSFSDGGRSRPANDINQACELRWIAGNRGKNPLLQFVFDGPLACPGISTLALPHPGASIVHSP